MSVGTATVEAAGNLVLAHPVEDHVVPLGFHVEAYVEDKRRGGCHRELSDDVVAWRGDGKAVMFGRKAWSG